MHTGQEEVRESPSDRNLVGRIPLLLPDESPNFKLYRVENLPYSPRRSAAPRATQSAQHSSTYTPGPPTWAADLQTLPPLRASACPAFRWTRRRSRGALRAYQRYTLLAARSSGGFRNMSDHFSDFRPSSILFFLSRARRARYSLRLLCRREGGPLGLFVALNGPICIGGTQAGDGASAGDGHRSGGGGQLADVLRGKGGAG